METLTPEIVRQRAASALVTLSTVFKRAGISPNTFYSWEAGSRSTSLLTKAKINKALTEIEAENKTTA